MKPAVFTSKNLLQEAGRGFRALHGEPDSPALAYHVSIFEDLYISHDTLADARKECARAFTESEASEVFDDYRSLKDPRG